MHIALLLVALTVTVIAGTALSERLRLPAPLVLIAIGVLGSFLPFVPAVRLAPEVVLVGLLPPLLYATSLQTSIIDVKANITTVALLSVALVVVTTVAVGGVVMLVSPDVGWPVALALGAVVAPPDAVAAGAIARRIGLPREIVTILEAEALLNDATALVALRAAIAAIAGAVSVEKIGGEFLLAAGGGLLVGVIVAFVVLVLRRRITDPVIDTGISFVIPFAAYLAGEHIHASGVIAVVVAGLLIGHKAAIVQTSRSRLVENATWSTIAFLLEHAVFLLIGLQVRGIVTRLREGQSLAQVAEFCLAVLLAVVFTRVVWVFAVQWLREFRTPAEARTPWSHAAVISWAGMRGVVTMAAVLVIPAEVPHHDVLVLAALTVVLGTLYVQGLSIPWLVRLLGVRPADPAADALARATLLQQAADAGMSVLERAESDGDPHGVFTMLRGRLDQRSFAAWERLSTTPGTEPPSRTYTRVREEMIHAERARVLQIRSEGQVPSTVVREVLGLLDVEESMLDSGGDDRECITATGTGQEGCAELQAFPARETPESPRCQDCEEEGTHPVALRMCLVCGRIGCCDSSAGRHATRHYETTGHAVIQSAEAGETWRWCYVHSTTA